jgi:energy-coupling factor transporter ATP-binding protein EcfA2
MADTNSISLVKRITSIKLNNFRAYFDNYAPIELEKGQNLLIYGENGSGKSSLFKALNNYLSKSINENLTFTKNRYNLSNDGEIKIAFSDFIPDTNERLEGPSLEYQFGSLVSNNNIPFIQDSALIKGFLDYTDLLNVYFHDVAQPNLFNLIVLSLLGNHIPVSSGGNFKFKKKWEQLQNDLLERPYTRNDRCHKFALEELPTFQTHLITTLNQVFAELNRMLSTYFFELNIEIDYNLADIDISYGRRWEWFVHSDLRLIVKKDGIIIEGDYSDFLNEARLSAFSICLYLASLKLNPSRIEFKILYLDDVFVGLDAGNRIPILNILQNEFKDYQIFISTYDRHWFELSKRHYEIHAANQWLSAEFYVGYESINTNNFNKPIIVIGETNLEKAIQFLHNRIKPDYPASANYFRKALEELIQKYIPKFELADAENTQIPEFQLTNLVYRTKNFLEKTNNDPSSINTIIGLLHTLLHPLSHHEISSPIYKSELISIEFNYIKLRNQLINLDIPNNYICCLEGSRRLKFTFTVDKITNHYYCYEIIIKETLVLIKNGSGQPIISLCHCVVDKMYGNKDNKPVTASNPNKKNPVFNYESLESAYNRIYTHLIASSIGTFPKLSNYLDSIEYHDGKVWQPLINIIIWR